MEQFDSTFSQFNYHPALYVAGMHLVENLSLLAQICRKKSETILRTLDRFSIFSSLYRQLTKPLAAISKASMASLRLPIAEPVGVSVYIMEQLGMKLPMMWN